MCFVLIVWAFVYAMMFLRNITFFIFTISFCRGRGRVSTLFSSVYVRCTIFNFGNTKTSIWHWQTFVVIVCKSSGMKEEAVRCANAHTIAVLLILLPKDPQNFMKEQRWGMRNISEEAKWDKTSNLLCVRLSSNVRLSPVYFHWIPFCIPCFFFQGFFFHWAVFLCSVIIALCVCFQMEHRSTPAGPHRTWCCISLFPFKPSQVDQLQLVNFTQIYFFSFKNMNKDLSSVILNHRHPNPFLCLSKNRCPFFWIFLFSAEFVFMRNN